MGATSCKRSGAKYVVMVSKHHDGFALWPSREANASWGRPWNSVDVGPKRDLVGELTAAVRRRGLEMGFYFSLYEWFNPLWLAGEARRLCRTPHVSAVQGSGDALLALGDLLRRRMGACPPSNGARRSCWPGCSTRVRSRQKVVVNDRWGKETRHRHGGYYTTEYGAGLPGADHAWEENRGMGHSYGYNRNEDLADYATGQRLLLTLLDTVSRGGNLLLNIGPTADGRIPVVMQERLAYLGQWLAAQRRGHLRHADVPRRRAVDRGAPGRNWTPRPTTARSTTSRNSPESRARRRPQGNPVHPQGRQPTHAILPRYPRGELTVRNLRIGKGARIGLLGSRHDNLAWRQSGEDLVISAPAIDDGELPFVGAYTFRIEGAGIE